MSLFTTRRPIIGGAICRLLLTVITISLTGDVSAHPLGNFTINHFARIESGAERARIRYVVDLAEVATFQELQKADPDSDGNLTEAELNGYLDQVTPGYLAGLKLAIDGAPVALRLSGKSISRAPGAAGLFTLRIVYDLTGEFTGANAAPRFRFENANRLDRVGWREIVVAPASGASVFDSTAYGSGLTDELRAYPEEMLMAPLNERVAEWSVTAGALPASARPLTLRDGKPVVAARDRFAELIAAPNLTPGVMLIGLLLAFMLGGIHATSPGHGKTVVGAYLAGSRGTAKHAAFLGLTVTITHTITVYAMLLVALFASHYVMPERLYPIIQFVSGALIVAIGLNLFIKRLRSLIGSDVHKHVDGHNHEAKRQIGWHSHGGSAHTHLPPGADEAPVTRLNLLALGVSGGLLPCPSATIVALAAVSLNRIGYGFLLILAFSLGLAGVLMAVGLMFVYAGRFMREASGASKLARPLSV
ncbi:MAG: nickel/cobalt transporter, partial [Blastocatellia bacterium]